MAEQIGSLYARVGADASSYHRTMGGVSSSLRMGAQRFSVFGRAGSHAFALIAAGGAAIGVLKGAVSATAQFESTVAQLGVQTDQGARGMQKMSDRAIALGADVKLPGTSAEDAAEAMLELAKGGQKMGQVMKSVRGVLVASAAGEMSNAEAANTVVGALGAFNLKANQSAMVANLLAGGANASTASMKDMALSLQMGGSAAAAAHVPIKTFVAMTAEMANAGIKGSDAGTSLKQMFLSLSPTSVKATNTIDKFGLSAFDAHHKMLPMPVIIGKYHDALAKMSDEQRVATLKTIFGSDAYRAANIIFGNGVPVLKKLSGEVGKQGQAAKLAAAKNSGMKGALDGVKSTWNSFQIVLGQRVAPAVKLVSKRLSTFLGDITRLIKPSKDLNSALGAMQKSSSSPLAFSAALVTPAVTAKSAQMFPTPTPPPGFQSGLQAAISKAFDGIQWDVIGAKVSAGFTAALDALPGKADKIVTSVMDAFEKHRSEFADIGAAMGVAILLKLVDPGFWIKHWDLAIGVALAVGPGKFAKLGGKLGEFLLKPFSGLAGKLGGLMGDAVLWAAGKAGDTLGGVVLNVGAWIGKALPDALKWGARLAGKLISGAVEGISKLSFKWRTIIYTAIATTIPDLANSAYNYATSLGRRIVDGAIDGIKGLGKLIKAKVEELVRWGLKHASPFSPIEVGAASYIGIPIVTGTVTGIVEHGPKIAGALKGALSDGFDGAKGWLESNSPSKRAARVIGLPISQGIVQGFLLGAGNLPETFTGKLRSALEAAKNVVTSRQTILSSAFQRLGEDISRAFEAGTTKGLARIAAKFDKLRRQAAAPGQTPAEKELADLQSGRDAAGRAQSIADARMALGTAQAGGDPQTILDAQRSLDDTLYQDRVAALQALADQQRTAADAEAALKTANYDKEQANAELQYQAQRDLQQRHMEAKLAAMELELEKNPLAFAKHHTTLMKWLKDVAGKDLKASGKNLGLAFAVGLLESQKAVGAAAHSLAAELQKYLKLNSPAEKGPLSSIDSWWTPLPKTLLGGIDKRDLAGVTSGLTSPGLGAALAAQSGGGGGTTIIHVPLTVEGILVHEGDLGAKIRDALLPIARRNGGSIFGGAA